MSPRRSLFALALLVAVAGCSKVSHEDAKSYAPAPSGAAAPCPGTEAVVDPTLLAFLSKARAIHHEADLAEDAGDKAGAVRALDELVVGPVPGGASPPPEAVEVLADTRARLADLRSRLGQSDAAERDVELGLRLATQPTHFRGHLYEMLGLVYERRAKALADTGNEAAAARAKQQAVEAYQRAVAVQDEVIRRALPATQR